MEADKNPKTDPAQAFTYVKKAEDKNNPNVTLDLETATSEPSQEISETSDLKKYFGPEPDPQNAASPDEFFSSLPPQKEQLDLQNKDSGNANKPILEKFFQEDKSGSDVTGKAFFDQIATNVPLPLNSAIKAVGDVPRSMGHEIGNFPAVLKLDASEQGLNDGEVEMYEAWIPSAETKKILITIVTSPAGTFQPLEDHFTRPSVIIEEEMVDPLKLMLVEINSPVANQRKVLSANDVPQNEDGLKELVEANCYHAAINLTSRLIKSGYGLIETGLTPRSLQVWFNRIALFVKLGKFSYAEVESEAFGNFDRPDMFYSFYLNKYPNKRGTMVPFSFRLLVAELPQYQGNHQVALNNLYGLLHVIKKVLQNLHNGFAEDGSNITISENRRDASIKLWQEREIRIFYSVLNCVLSQKDYVMAVSVAQILMKKDKDSINQLNSAMGRIYLQLGDLRQAQHFFRLLNTCGDNDKLNIERLINEGLLAVAQNNNEEAYKLYSKALSLEPNNAMIINNMAVCLLYMGRLKESLSLLEKTIQANPKACLHEGILFNICTLYELESSHCTIKKQAMLNLISGYAGDNLNISCLKIPPSIKG